MTVDTNKRNGHPGRGKGTVSFPAIASSPQSTNIIDIRRDVKQESQQNAIFDGLDAKDGGEKRLPTLLLYDDIGLKLFEQITYLDEYYLTNTEIGLLEAYADKIARRLQPGSILVELGSGNLRKVKILLRAIDRLGKHVEYYALDLSCPELERTLSTIPEEAYKHVKCLGLLGTYDDGLEWLKRPEVKAKLKTVLSLGSSIGNFSRLEAAAFLRSFAEVLQPGDSLLLGIDGCKDGERVTHAYNDSEGITHQFYANALRNANKIIGKGLFDPEDWEILGEWNEAESRHEAFVSPREDTIINNITIIKGEKVRLEEAYKYDARELATLWEEAGLAESFQCSNDRKDYILHIVQKNRLAMPQDPQIYAAAPVPSLAEWDELWILWDAVTRKMLPDEDLLEKPIKLRNACIFYLGHIPTFFDIKLHDTTDGKYTQPDYFPNIFERGIDPDVDNPEQCHAHSEVPDEWPPLEEILEYQGRVRERVRRLYASAEADTPKVGRTLWLGYEHEAMHLETLLYMLIQSEKTLPPPETPTPNFEQRAEQAEEEAKPNEWFTVPTSDIVVGINDPETTDGHARHFGWDIEKPARKVHVQAFAAKARPITIGEYAFYLQETGSNKTPASWIQRHTGNGHTNGHTISDILKDHTVRTVFGSVPLQHASSWPVSASYDELKGCAAWMGGRIPTFEEARSLYSYVDQMKMKQILNSNKNGKMIPAVNGEMINDGVEETPPSNSNFVDGDVAVAVDGEGRASRENYGKTLDAKQLFVDLRGCNVGFQKWHPTSVTQNGGRPSGQGDFGGLWEWTSSTLKRHKRYEPMPLYPAYSSDFFDDKHNIVLGGSWATVPRIAGRKSFVNWYQRNYPYVWAGARLVKDL